MAYAPTKPLIGLVPLRWLLAPSGALLVTALLLSAGSSALAQAVSDVLADTAAGGDQVQPKQDPFEGFNQLIFEFNRKYADPAAGEVLEYVTAKVPGDVRLGVSNVLANLGEPITAVSSLVLGEFDNAKIAAHRFVINSTLGLGGYFDRAGEMGVVSERKDLGQAICSIGMPDGPYLVLPLYGPATVSDVMGSIVPMVAGYLTFGNLYWTWRAGYRVATVLEGEDQAKATATTLAPTLPTPPVPAAIDTNDYRTQRAAYLRHRDTACRGDQAVEAVDAAPTVTLPTSARSEARAED
ncbi:phospholipid-binding lipoprotein MlaA [uncultured Gammaproteobacteria bacterium]